MAQFVWQEKFSVGIPTIDREHKQLVELLNELLEAMQAGHGQDVLKDVLNKLVGYTASHFKNEERLMQQCGYPGFAEHKAKHDAMTAKVLDLQQKVNSGSHGVTLEVGNFLRGWLNKHILETDMDYSPSMKAAGIK